MSRYEEKTFRWAPDDTGRDGEIFRGILVRPNLAIYRVQDGDAEVSFVEPDNIPGQYRTVGAGIVLLTQAPLDQIADRLQTMSGLDLIAQLLPNYYAPAELPFVL